MTWCVTGFGQGGAKGGGFVALHSCLLGKLSGKRVGLGFFVRFSMRSFERSRLHCTVSCFFWSGYSGRIWTKAKIVLG